MSFHEYAVRSVPQATPQVTGEEEEEEREAKRTRSIPVPTPVPVPVLVPVPAPALVPYEFNEPIRSFTMENGVRFCYVGRKYKLGEVTNDKYAIILREKFIKAYVPADSPPEVIGLRPMSDDDLNRMIVANPGYDLPLPIFEYARYYGIYPVLTFEMEKINATTKRRKYKPCTFKFYCKEKPSLDDGINYPTQLEAAEARDAALNKAGLVNARRSINVV